MIGESADEANAGLLRLVTFWWCPETEAIISRFYDRFVDEVTKPLENETLIRNLAVSVLRILDMQDRFQKIIYDVDDVISKRVRQVMVLGLKRSAFPVRFGGRFPIALAFIVDAFLKRGNAFKSSIKDTSIIKLVSYAIERDIFLAHYKHTVFWRLATRSTIGLTHEIKFADSIAGVVQEENLGDVRQLLEQGIERVEPAYPKFSYLNFQLSLCPKRLPEALFAFATEYESSKNAVQAILKKKFPTKSFKWVDGIATADLKLRTSAGFSLVSASLGQVQVLSALCSAATVSFLELVSLVRGNADYARILVKPICDCKMAIAEGIGPDGNWDAASISMNPSFLQKRVVIADNWTPKTLKIKELDRVRFNATVACIVRIMKGSRMIKIRQLIEGTLKEASLLFPITLPDIQKCMQHLLTQGYMEKSGEDHVMYLE
jgi:hypothetical protein